MRLSEYAPPYIRGIAPYQPGKPISELARELNLDEATIVKLASNENPLGISPRALAAIRGALDDLARYPDGNGFELKQALMRRYGVAMESLVLGNGSNDVLDLAARAFLSPDTEAVYSQHAFAVYPLAVQAIGARGIEVPARNYGHDLDAMARAVTAHTRLVFIANPNNPTATIVTADEFDHFMARVPDRTIVVVDEAYVEFAHGPDFPDTFSYVRQGRKIVVLRTFSKANSLAGLRLGYAVADPDAIALLNRIRQPFNVNSLAQAAGLAALDDEHHVVECVRMNEAGKAYLYEQFRELGVRYVPSRANFILVDVGRSAADIYQKLLHEGLIVRPMTAFGMETALRITVGTPDENRRLVKGLRAVLGSKRA